jgi:hypothetical protein
LRNFRTLLLVVVFLTVLLLLKSCLIACVAIVG